MPFEFLAADSLETAARTLADHPGDAFLIAGGTDVLVQHRDGRLAPDLVVSLHQIPGLDVIQVEPDGGVRLGPLVTASQVAAHHHLRERYPALVEGARAVGAWLIQNRATLAGNLCNASPAADTIPALLAHAARLRLLGPAGARELPVAEFFTGPGQTVRQKGEILTEIRLPAPAPAPDSSSAYEKLSPRGAMDIAVVGVAVYVALAGDTLAEVGIGLGAVAPTPIRAGSAEALLRGQPLSEARLAEAARLAREAVRPISDVRGSATYRQEMVEALIPRVTRRAVERARNLGGNG